MTFKSSNAADTLLEDVGFIVTGDSKQNCYVLPRFGLISTCYATTKCARWKNEILQSSFELSFDKMLIISSDTIPPNTNLFQVSSFLNGVEILKEDDDCKFVVYTINLTSNLLNQISFEQGIYTTSFICKTSDNKVFSKQRPIVFKL